MDQGMTYTYQNYNWWNKGNTWTEPCAVVDSLILFGDLYELTGCEEWRTLAIASMVLHLVLSLVEARWSWTDTVLCPW